MAIVDINTKKLLQHLKSSAKKRGLSCTLTESDLRYLSFPITCPIMRIPLRYDIKGYHPQKPSIDRIDSAIGYEAENIWVISFQANKCKNNLTDKELEQFALYYLKK